MSRLKTPKGRGFTEIGPGDFQRRVIGKLGPCVDVIRDIYTKIGARTYATKMVKTRWSEGVRGDGVEEVIEEKVILPTPKITSLVNLDALVTGVGVNEMGGVKLSQISMCFTEDELAGRQSDGSALPTDQNFFYEIDFFSNLASFYGGRCSVIGAVEVPMDSEPKESRRRSHTSRRTEGVTDGSYGPHPRKGSW